MIILSILILTLVTLGIIMLVIRDAIHQNPELISVRNTFLAGFVIFQCTSGLLAILRPVQLHPFAIPDLTGPSMVYSVTLLLFIITFLLIYRSGMFANRIVRMTKESRVYVTWPKLLSLSVLCFILGVLCRLVFVHIPYLGIFSLHFGASFLALATGLATWAWMPRFFNPIPMMIAIAIILASLAVFFSDSLGRRDIVGIGLAFFWGAYYSHWRYMSAPKLIANFTVMGTIGIVFLAAFTSTRFNFGIKNMASISQRVKELASADIGQGVADLFSGQLAAANSMYFIYTRPDPFVYDTLHSAKLVVTLPIPRRMWPGKPDALGITSTREISTAGKPAEWNIGPGLIGHIHNDNPYLALPLYAFILAFSAKLADGLLSKHATNPFIVRPFGVALGQILGIARGELGTFYAKTVVYTIAGWFVMMLAARLLRLVSPNSSMFVAEDEYEDEEYDQDQGSETSSYPGYEDYDAQSNQY